MPSGAGVDHIYGQNLVFTVSAVVPAPNRSIPDSEVHVANMGPIWGRQGPDGPHVSLMNFAIWDGYQQAQQVSLAISDFE